jgi:hypothetical protein
MGPESCSKRLRSQRQKDPEAESQKALNSIFGFSDDDDADDLISRDHIPATNDNPEEVQMMMIICHCPC